MIPSKREDGTTSRTMRDVRILAMLVAFEGSMAAFKGYIPEGYLWLYPVIHAAVLVRIAYLRATTNQGLKK